MRGRGPRLLLWLALLPAPAAVGEVDGSLGASNDNVFRGLTLSDGQASLFADAHVLANQWFLGLSAESVRHDPDPSAGAQVIAYGGYLQPLGDSWSAAVELRHYDYPGNSQRSRYDYDELSTTVSWQQRLTLAVIASPDTYAVAGYERYGRGAAFAFELSAQQPLRYAVSAEAGVGYYDLQQEVGAGYAYWDAGLSRQWRAWQLAVRYVGTDATAHRLFGTQAGDRVVASLQWFF
jgi:uncharacterized protein (TIGR02001 family)